MGLALSSLLVRQPPAPLDRSSGGCRKQACTEFDEDLPALEEATGHESDRTAGEADRMRESEWRLVSRHSCRLGKGLGVCMVCFDEGFVLQLECQHTMCRGCLRAQLAARWPGSRMTFGYLNCAACRAPLMHPSIREAIDEHQDLRRKAVEVAAAQYQADDLHLELARSLCREPTEREIAKRAEIEMAVYTCHDCREPFCGGRVDCIQALERESRGEDLRCQECNFRAEGRKDRRCLAHGPRFAVYKCDSCCNVASWICAGGNHYCERCHSDPCSEKHYPCPGPGLCPLGMAHPPNGPGVLGDNAPGFVVGCTACMGCVDWNDEKGSEWGEDHSGWVEPMKPRVEVEDDDLNEQPAEWTSRKERHAATLSTGRLRQAARRARTSMVAAVAMTSWDGRRSGCRRQRLTHRGSKGDKGSISRGSPSKRAVVRGGRHKVSLFALEDVNMEVDSPCTGHIVD